MGAAKDGYERITGEFAIGTKLCAEPRVDPLLTVTYAYLEKGVVTQAISGPFDLGRPTGCRPDAFSGSTRLNPKPPVIVHKKKHSKKAHAKKAHHKKAQRQARPAPRSRSGARGAHSAAPSVAHASGAALAAERGRGRCATAGWSSCVRPRRSR